MVDNKGCRFFVAVEQPEHDYITMGKKMYFSFEEACADPTCNMIYGFNWEGVLQKAWEYTSFNGCTGRKQSDPTGSYESIGF